MGSSFLSRSNRLYSRTKHDQKLYLNTLEERITPFSASGNKWPSSQLITVSFMPDGTSINGKTSNLISTFNTKFGSSTTWQNVFKEAAQVWAAQTNINFKFVTDNGAASGSGSNQQGDPGFGDIRIGGYNFGTTTLAQAYMPPPVNNYSIAGDIAFNTGQSFNIGSTYNLFTVASHEIGHALGLNHGAVGSVMASAYPGTLTALQTDDISGIRSIYSAGAVRAKDSLDTTAANETFATASLVTSSINTTSKAGVINNLDLSTSTDVDWFKFVVPSGSSTQLTVRAVATGLSMLDPKIEIYDSANTLKASTNGAAYGSTASATYSGIAAGQTWYVKVSSIDAKASFKTGRYALILNMGTGADPAITFPTTLKANGTPLTSGGGTAINDGIETPVNGSSTFSSGATSKMVTSEAGASVAITVGEPKIAMDSKGNYVVVWVSNGQDGSGQGIYAQLYNSSGVAQGSPFLVNTTTAGDQCAPAVAMKSNGDFIVTWQSYNQDAANSWGIYSQNFNALGVKQGSESRVNTTTAGDQITPVVNYSANNSYVIAWASYNQDAANSWGIYAQNFSNTGVVNSKEYRANTTTAGDQVGPIVGLDNKGNFAIGWSSYNQASSTSGWDVYVQRYFAGVVPAGGELLINQTTAGDQFLSSAAMTPTGNWLVVWTSNGQDGSGQGVYARRYDGLGQALGNEFRVNTTTAGDQTNPSATSDSYGNFYVTWQSYNQDAAGTWGIYGQQFSSSGASIGTEFLVNSTLTGDQVNPVTMMDDLGHLVVVWNGNGVNNTDGVFSQRYSVNTSLEIPPVGDSYDPLGHDHHDEHRHDSPNRSALLNQGISYDPWSRELDIRALAPDFSDDWPISIRDFNLSPVSNDDFLSEILQSSNQDSLKLIKVEPRLKTENNIIQNERTSDVLDIDMELSPSSF